MADSAKKMVHDEVTSIFLKLGLRNALDRLHVESAEDDSQKYRYFSNLQAFLDTSVFRTHSFLWVVRAMMLLVWQFRMEKPKYKGPVIDQNKLVSYLYGVQDVGWVQRRLCIEKLLNHLDMVYCVSCQDAQKKLQRQRKELLETQLQVINFKKCYSLSQDFLQQVRPFNLFQFSKEEENLKMKAKDILLDMVHLHFSKSMHVQEKKAKEMADGIEKIIQMSATALPCLTGERCPVSGVCHSAKMMGEVMSKLSPEFIFPELCALAFQNRRSEFLRELCLSLQSQETVDRDVKVWAFRSIPEPRQSVEGRLMFTEIVHQVFSLLGKVHTQSLVEVLCISVLLLESAFSPEEQKEIKSLLHEHLVMLEGLYDASQELGNQAPRPVKDDLVKFGQEIDYLLYGDQFLDISSFEIL